MPYPVVVVVNTNLRWVINDRGESVMVDSERYGGYDESGGESHGDLGLAKVNVLTVFD